MLNRRELLGYVVEAILMAITLNLAETFRYGVGTLTKPFIDRVFQECLTYGGEVVSY